MSRLGAFASVCERAGESANVMEHVMRSLNVGIAGLALLGGAALLPQSAMATASYLMDVTLDSSASTTSGGATISYENFFDGIQRVGGSYGTSGNATYDFSTKTELPPVGVPSSQISSSTIAVRQTGSASGIDGGGTSVTREGFSSDFSTEDLDVLTNDNTLGTLITVSDVAAGTSLDISVNFFALLSGAVAFPADEEWRAYSSWTIQMSTRDADSEDPADWSDFTTEFGSLAGQIAGGATPHRSNPRDLAFILISSAVSIRSDNG